MTFVIAPALVFALALLAFTAVFAVPAPVPSSSCLCLLLTISSSWGAAVLFPDGCAKPSALYDRPLIQNAWTTICRETGLRCPVSEEWRHLVRCMLQWSDIQDVLRHFRRRRSSAVVVARPRDTPSIFRSPQDRTRIRYRSKNRGVVRYSVFKILLASSPSQFELTLTMANTLLSLFVISSEHSALDTACGASVSLILRLSLTTYDRYAKE